MTGWGGLPERDAVHGKVPSGWDRDGEMMFSDLLVATVGWCFFCRFVGVFDVRLGECVRLGVMVGLYPIQYSPRPALTGLDHSLGTP